MLSKLLSTETADLAAKSLDRLAELILRSVDALKSQVKGRESAVGLAAAAVGLHLYYWYKLTFWSRRGIKSAPAIPFLGSYYAFLLKPRMHIERDWISKYGKFYGYYVGTQAMIACTDLDVMNQICIRDFSKFRNHSLTFAILNRYEENFLSMSKDEKWHASRAFVCPIFSSGRLKTMFRLIDRSADDLVEAYENKIRESDNGAPVVDPLVMFRYFAIDASLNSFLTLSLDQQGEATKRAIMDRSQQVMRASLVRVLASIVLPSRLLRSVGFATNSTSNLEFYDKTTQVIKERRRKSGKRYNDYLQILMDHEDSEMRQESSEDSQSANKKSLLTNKELTAQLLAFLAGGGEGLGQAISNVILILAHHPEVQSRLYEEISALELDRSKEGCTFDYEKLNSCTYLSAVISEAFRVAPLGLAADRVAEEDYYIEKYGVTIPKGTVIIFVIHSIMRDPDNWPDPLKFDPSRFYPENKANIKPGSYCPFGIGPRFCLAYRYSLMQVKLSLARLLLKFEFKPSDESKYPPDIAYKGYLFSYSRNLVVPVARSKNN